MKKIVQAILFACLLFLNIGVQAQTTEPPKFISKILPPIPVVMSETDVLRVSYIDGTVEQQKAFSLVFENKSDAAITFTWTLKDKNGQDMAASLMTLAPHEKIDFSNAGDIAEFLIYTVDDNTHPADCTISLTF